jgi:hypothetical protein
VPPEGRTSDPAPNAVEEFVQALPRRTAFHVMITPRKLKAFASVPVSGPERTAAYSVAAAQRNVTNAGVQLTPTVSAVHRMQYGSRENVCVFLAGQMSFSRIIVGTR